jgi:hypothetical protein
MGQKIDTVSTLRLKACHAPPDTEPALPPRRGRPPLATQPSVAKVPTSPGIPAQRKRGRPKRVSFSCPPVVAVVPPATPSFHPSGRPVRFVRSPLRLVLSLDSNSAANTWGGAVGRRQRRP